MFKLNPNPTFKADVKITVPGGDPLPVTFEFKHKTRTGLAEWQRSFVQTAPDPTPNAPDQTKTLIKPDRDIVAEYIVGWEGPVNEAGDREPWSVEAFLKFCDNYHTAQMEVYVGYVAALSESRTKN